MQFYASYLPDLSFNTQPPEGGCDTPIIFAKAFIVSTHSRPKAAAKQAVQLAHLKRGFNTQPPEGGCGIMLV